MRDENQDAGGAAHRRERILIAAARERAARARAHGARPGRLGEDPFTLEWAAGGGSAPAEPPSTALPGYELECELARGGQGVVYRALQHSTGRRVAIKVMKEGPFAGPDDKARFDREVRILGQLDHPSIVTIHDSGVAAGCFYFVMDHVPGPTLDAYVRVNHPTLAERIGLFALVCEAVNAAHLRGIIHRDLKPSNIRIGADGNPRILDFGLAKTEAEPIGSEVAALSTMTQAGQFVGSLPWAAPEQVAGGQGGVDVRCDVYALGVVLFHMLTNAFPYDVRGGMPEVAQRILHDEPIRPSAAVERGGRNARSAGGWSGGMLRRRIDGELDTIVLKCLSKDRARRYQTAGELARDLRHYLPGEPIEARRDALGYVLRKQVQRHRTAFGVAVLVLVALVSALAVSLVFWRQSVDAQAGLEKALDRAKTSERETRQVADAQAKMLRGVDPSDMGEQLRADVLAEARAAMQRDGAGEQQVADGIARLDSLLAGTNFTNVGVRTIDRNILAPTLEAVDRDFKDQPLVQAALWASVASAYQQLGRFESALPPASRALEVRRRLLGDDDPDTIESLDRMGSVLLAQGKAEDANPYVQQALAGYRGVVEARRRALGPDHPDTLAALHRLALILWWRKQYDEAEPVVREAMEGRMRVLGPDDPGTLDAIAGMGTILWEQGRCDEAEPYYLQVLEGRRRVLGEDHPDTLMAISNLGILLRRAGRLQEAETYSREALEGLRRVLGDEHDWTLVRIRNLVDVLQDQGRFEEAEAYERELLGHYRKLLGDEHRSTLSSMKNLGLLLLRQGAFAEAETICREAMEGLRRSLGDDHATTLGAISNLGQALRGLGRLDEAEALGAEAMQRARDAVEPVPQRTGAFLVEHAKTLAAMGRFEEAEAELLEAHDLIEAGLGASHRRTQDAIAAIIELEDAWEAAQPGDGHAAAAEAWRSKLESPLN